MKKLFLSVLLLALALPVAAKPLQTPQDLVRAGHADEAIRMLREQVKNTPGDAEAWNLLGRTYLTLERWDDAVKACEKAVNLEPGNSGYHLWLGRAYGLKAEHSIFFTAIRLARRTRDEFAKAVELRSDNLDAQTDLAEYFIEAPAFLGGGKDKAEAQAQKVAAVDPPTAAWIEARLAEKDGRMQDAENNYKTAIATAKAKAPCWLNLASFYQRQKRYSDMEQAVNKAVAAERSHDDIFYESAELLFKAGRNFPVAAQFVRHYLMSEDKVEMAPTFQAHYLLGSILEKMGDPHAAAVEYRAALSLAKDYEPAQDALKRISP